MREIKFRGKTPDGRWVYGDLLHAEHNFKKGIDIVTDDWKQETVNPETVGQFTGYCDVDGNEIYEGDIIEQDETCKTRFIVVFDDCAFRIATRAQKESLDRHCHPYSEDYRELPSLNSAQMSAPFRVIGNIFDNSDLI